MVKLKCYLKDNGGTFTENNPGRKITKSTWSASIIATDGQADDNFIETQGWTKSPYIYETLFINNIFINDKVFTIDKIENKNTNLNLSGGETVKIQIF